MCSSHWQHLWFSSPRCLFESGTHSAPTPVVTHALCFSCCPRCSIKIVDKKWPQTPSIWRDSIGSKLGRLCSMGGIEAFSAPVKRSAAFLWCMMIVLQGLLDQWPAVLGLGTVLVGVGLLLAACAHAKPKLGLVPKGSTDGLTLGAQIRVTPRFTPVVTQGRFRKIPKARRTLCQVSKPAPSSFSGACVTGPGSCRF